MRKKVMVFAPHPDDAEFYAGGTLAKMSSEGYAVIIVTVTDGNKGSFDYSSDQLIQIRIEEAKKAAHVLGAEPPIMLGYHDFELDKLPPGQLREQFIHLIRQYKPDVVIAEDPFSTGEPHPDHRTVAWAASDAINFSTLPLLYPEHKNQGLEPHFIVEKYLYSNQNELTNKIIDISDTFEKKMAAMAEHQSQVKFLVEDIFIQARLAGIDLGNLLGEMATNHLQALTWAMQAQAAEVGEPAGYAYGEAFRYTRFHSFVEDILSAQS